MSRFPPCRLVALLLGGVFAAAPPAQSATEIAGEPLATMPAVRPKPNVMFVLDDSGSMDWLYMPDEMRGDTTYGYWSAQCNGIAFDPAQDYPLPVRADGSRFPNARFGAAPSDGYDATSPTTDLAGSTYYVYTGTQKPLDWTYTADGPVTTTTFYRECRSRIGAQPGRSVFAEKTVAPELQQKYANWYAYYRKRYLAMRASASLAFGTLDAGYRVGFATINDASDVFLDVKDFDDAQRARFFDSLFKALPTETTPLRQALSRAGRYYAKKRTRQRYDPVQYSCQRNYAILSTDGYWNSTAGTTLDGGSIGQQDGDEPPPMHDGTKADGSGGATDTLADTAEYYYRTDLRTAKLGNCAGGDGRDVCTNDVQPNGRDEAAWQHMTTFTIGMGVNGTLTYDPQYLTQTQGAYADLVAGRITWPIPGSDAGAPNVDDLWHAAVNGRGQYFSARNSEELASAIVGALSGVQTQSATGSAAGFSSQRLNLQQERKVFVSTYTTGDWTGDLAAYTIADDGTVATKALWSAQSALSARPAADRRIYYLRPGTTSLAAFTYDNLAADRLNGAFDGLCSKPQVASQCAGFKATTIARLATGDELVAFLRGGAADEGTLFRERKGRLGDIVNAAPVHAGRSPLSYADGGHAAYVAGTATRTPVVYVAANDGMLHAFSAADGSELWAYVPGAMMPEMYRLADRDYASRHRFFVDGTPVVGDARIGGVWKTVLVGGFNAGGRGYYALDVSDPSAPRGLWEFSDANLGLSFGNPVITKRADGSWVVAVTSGHNNADGRGHLFLIDLANGRKLLDLVTSAGTPADPSGLARIDAWVESTSDNTALRFYGGDLQGHLWRFDTEDRVPPAGSEATLLATLRAGDTAQPITTAPRAVQVISGPLRVPAVAVATGRWLAAADSRNADPQSIYLIRDRLDARGVGNPRESTAFVRQTATVRGTTVDVSRGAVDWARDDGWFFDLPNARERVSIDPLALGSKLAIASVVPNIEICGATTFGSSWMYLISLDNGSGAKDDGSAAVEVQNGIVAFSVLETKDGASVMATDSKGKISAIDTQIGKEHVRKLRRSAWREFVN